MPSKTIPSSSVKPYIQDTDRRKATMKPSKGVMRQPRMIVRDPEPESSVERAVAKDDNPFRLSSDPTTTEAEIALAGRLLHALCDNVSRKWSSEAETLGIEIAEEEARLDKKYKRLTALHQSMKRLTTVASDDEDEAFDDDELSGPEKYDVVSVFLKVAERFRVNQNSADFEAATTDLFSLVSNFVQRQTLKDEE